MDIRWAQSSFKLNVMTSPHVQLFTVNMELFFSLPGKGKPLDTDSGAITNSTEDENLVEMGKPRLGDITKMKIYIKESQEFKVKNIIYSNILHSEWPRKNGVSTFLTATG